MNSVLVVDDDDLVRVGLERMLHRNGYDCAGAQNVPEARALLADRTFDVVLCDIQMPGESGIDLLREIAVQLPDVAVVMITGMDDPMVARDAFEIGAYAFIVKPFEQNEILIALMNAVRRRDLERDRRRHTEELEGKVLDRTVALQEALDRLERGGTEGVTSSEKATVDRLAKALTLRDEETGHHIERMSRYCAVLGRRYGFDAKKAEEIRLASMLHDVGKIGVPDGILLKPGRLEAGEFEKVKRHPAMGHSLLAGSPSNVLALGATIALTHHERWDGSGYGAGLMGETIPLEGRIAAVGDVFDALTSKRVYRPSYSVDDAVQIMRDGRGSHFDPSLLDLFLEDVEEVLAIREQFSDEAEAEEIPTIRVLIVDDHPLFAESLLRILRRAKGIAVAGTAGSIREAVSAAGRQIPDVVLLDWDLPDGTGQEAATAIRAEHPGARIIILTGYGDEAVVQAAIESGCSGFLAKTQAANEVVTAVRAAYEGEAVMPLSMVRSTLSRMAVRAPAARHVLTPHEAEVLTLLAHGYSNEAIAERLAVSVDAVREHVRRAIAKLETRSKLEAITTAVREGLITIGSAS